MDSNPFRALSRYLEECANQGVNPDPSLTYEGFRLMSFNCINIATSTLRLAASGFYATKNGDETKCYSCGVTYRGWRSCDNPFIIHGQISSKCRLVTDTATDSVQGEPRLMPLTSSEIPVSRHSVMDVERGIALLTLPRRQNTLTPPVATPVSRATTSTSVSTSRLSVTADNNASAVPSPRSSPTGRLTSLKFDRAIHPQYSDQKDRLTSFGTWPLGHCKKPEDLVKAGFFYAGYADCVRCFVCGVGLRTWEDEDDPWMEHVRWRSSCDYVMMVKGQDFVIDTLAAIGRENRSVINNDTLRNAEPASREQALDIMETAECRRAIEMGFDKEHVRQGANAITSGRGRQSLSFDVLIERLITDEDIMPSGTSSQQTPTSVSAQTFDSSDYCTDSDHGESEDDHGQQDHPESGLIASHMSAPGAHASDEYKQQKLDEMQLVQMNKAKEERISYGNRPGSVLYPGHKSLPVLDASRNDAKAIEKKTTSLPVDFHATEEENRQLKEANQCKVCLDDPANIVFLPCGHLVTCATCAPALERCPVCRTHVRGTVRVHLAKRASMHVNQ